MRDFYTSIAQIDIGSLYVLSHHLLQLHYGFSVKERNIFYVVFYVLENIWATDEWVQTNSILNSILTSYYKFNQGSIDKRKIKVRKLVWLSLYLLEV